MSILRSAAVSWKTTLVGVLLFIEALVANLVNLLDESELTQPDWNLVVMAFFAMTALIAARDGDKSSEDHKPKR